MKRIARLLNTLDRAGARAEDALLVFILVSMILLAGTQILLRNLFDTSLFWGDEMLRLMVLWLAVAGGIAASRLDKHISIAVIDRFLPATAKLVTRVVIDLFTAALCALFAWQSARFVYSSYEFGDTVMRDAPAWAAQVIMPIGFTLMSLRHLVLAFTRPLRGRETFGVAGGDS